MGRGKREGFLVRRILGTRCSRMENEISLSIMALHVWSFTPDFVQGNTSRKVP